MWVLIMIVMLGGQGVTTTHLYYEDEIACKAAAMAFESNKTKDMKLKAFCIRGDKG